MPRRVWGRTQHWVCRAVLFPTVWGQQKTEHNFRAPVPPGLCQPGGEAGATEQSYCCSERGLPRGHRTRQEAGWARQPRAMDLLVSHIPEDINCSEFCSEYHWYHRRHGGKASQLDIWIWASQSLLHTPVLSSTYTTFSGDVGRILMSLGSISWGMLGGVYKVHLATF